MPIPALFAAQIPRQRRQNLFQRRALTCAAAATIALASAATAAPAASAATPMYLGAVGGVQELSRQTGQPLATHGYAHFDQGVPDGRMITVRSSASWRTVATAGPGSSVYADIVRWAQTIKSRPGPIFFAYHHEPEASGSAGYGTAADFVAAYRRVVSIFRAQGVRNVLYTWQMTDWAFRTSPSDARYATKWYPGDSYVDVVGADIYNWSACRTSGGTWDELSAMAGPFLAFARAHGKQAALPELGSDADARRAQWLRNAHAYLVANRDVLAAVFYFNRGPTQAAHSACTWTLTQAAEQRAFGDMARDRAYFRS